MKYPRKLLLILALIPFLALQSVETRADGGEDPPHGRPEQRDDSVKDSSSDRWDYLTMLLGEIL